MFIAFFLFVSIFNINAETILLENGNTIEGDIVEQTEHSIAVKSDGSYFTVARKYIKQIIKGSIDSNSAVKQENVNVDSFQKIKNTGFSNLSFTANTNPVYFEIKKDMPKEFSYLIDQYNSALTKRTMAKIAKQNHQKIKNKYVSLLKKQKSEYKKINNYNLDIKKCDEYLTSYSKQRREIYDKLNSSINYYNNLTLKINGAKTQQKRNKLRKALNQASKKNKYYKNKMNKIDADIQNIRKKRSDLVLKYNKIKENLVSFQSKLEENKQQQEQYLEKYEQVSLEYKNKRTEFLNNFSYFYKKIKDKYHNERIINFFEAQVNIIRQDFNQYEIPFRKSGNAIIVTALLNNSINADFILDTGASSMVVSEALAKRIGVTILAKGKSKVADGRTVDTSIGLIRSVRVGHAEAKNVITSIMPSDVDGLLGMTFLSNFKLTVKSNKILLEELK